LWLARELARDAIAKAFSRPLNLETLRCSAEVVLFDLRPLWEVARKLEEGTKVRDHRSPTRPGLLVLARLRHEQECLLPLPDAEKVTTVELPWEKS
jgi:hypothetical protein